MEQSIMRQDLIFLLNVKVLTDVKPASQKSQVVTGLKLNILFIPWSGLARRLRDEHSLLASCYQTSLALAKEKN